MIIIAKDKLINKISIEQIRNKPILAIAASFWEDDRLGAFKTCYKSMRIIDDIVDDRKAEAKKISIVEKQLLKTKIQMLVNSIKKDPKHKELAVIIERYKIPIWPWKNLVEAMIYDLSHGGFKTFSTFLKYSEGAAVAPGSIFMHLCGVVKKNERYFSPEFDVEKAARPLAIFSYLVHIIRDFQKDQNSNLNYFADDLIAENGLSREELKKIAKGGEIGSGFRNLIKAYYKVAETYQVESRKMLDKISNYLEPRYILSLEVLFSLYCQIFERIDALQGMFTTDELNPSAEEIKERIEKVISSFERKD